MYETKVDGVELVKVRGEWLDIVYSPDDGGYYAQRDDGSATEVYKTRKALMSAIAWSSVTWQ